MECRRDRATLCASQWLTPGTHAGSRAALLLAHHVLAGLKACMPAAEALTWKFCSDRG